VCFDQVLCTKLAKILNDSKGELEETMTDQEKQQFATNPAHFTERVLEDILDSLEVDLPKPTATKFENLKSSFEAQEEALDKVLPYVISSDMLPQDFVGNVADYVEAVRSIWKGFLLRQWMTDNNYVTEALDISSRTDDGKPMIDICSSLDSYSETLMLSVIELLNRLKAAKMAGNKDIEAASGGEEPEGYTSSDSSSSESSDEGEGGGEGEGFGDFEEGGEGEGGGDAMSDNPFTDLEGM
jgi:hypothetical protein